MGDIDVVVEDPALPWYMTLAFVCVLSLGFLASKILEWYDDRKEKLNEKERESTPPPHVELRRSERIAGRKMRKDPWR
jgi:hypothetical protein